MKIALLSTCALATPPHKYGGTELVVAELAKGLSNLGHDVTVFATGDSQVRGELHYHFERPVWPPNELAETRHACFAWREVAKSLAEYDVVHVNHGAGLPYHLHVPIPTVMTIHHARVDELVEHYRAFETVAYVAISERQAQIIPEIKISRVIHHGLDPTLYTAGKGDGGYVAFLGRFAPEKAPHLAIDAARAANVRLRMGGTYHEVAADYYAREMQPRLANASHVECCGELGHEAKVELLRGATAMLFPIQWEEPFGLVMIESMLIGTPVIAFRNGSAPEVVEEGVTGFVVDNEQQMAQRIGELGSIDRARCRERARARWCSTRMAREYAELYQHVARGRRAKPALRIATAHARPGIGASLLRENPQSSKQRPAAKELDHAATIRAGRG
jgi:glycosyltransferase involved in cell wall biosynthesis